MIAGSKRVAYSRLSADQIIYSEEATEMGGKCGRRINLFPRNPDDEREPVEYSACKIEAFLWLGNARYPAACWSAIPPGYEIDHNRNVDTFPKYIEYNQFSVRDGWNDFGMALWCAECIIQARHPTWKKVRLTRVDRYYKTINWNAHENNIVIFV